MTGTHATRIKRLDRLEGVISSPGTSPSRCLSTSQLLELMAGHDDYGGGHQKHRRSLQMDLEALVQAERIEVVNPGGKPLRYRRTSEDPRSDPLIWDYTLKQIEALAAEVVPRRELSRLWERLMDEREGQVLDAGRLRILSDTFRLQPVALHPRVLVAVLHALAHDRALAVLYENAEGKRSKPLLHPQALVQRGPIPYLLALKNDEDDPVRLYALHRMIRAELAPQTPARRAQDFDLDQAIQDGRLDFGQDDWIDLELRVRGYLTEVVKACPLDPGQTWTDEPDESDFDIRVAARLPSTGQLLRWLLGAGDNVEVIAPEELRLVMASQAAKMARLYQGSSGTDLGEAPATAPGLG